MRADEFIRLCMVLNLDMYHFLTKDMLEDLQSRKHKMIEDFGTGLGGLNAHPNRFK